MDARMRAPNDPSRGEAPTMAIEAGRSKRWRLPRGPPTESEAIFTDALRITHTWPESEDSAEFRLAIQVSLTSRQFHCVTILVGRSLLSGHDRDLEPG